MFYKDRQELCMHVLQRTQTDPNSASSMNYALKLGFFLQLAVVNYS